MTLRCTCLVSAPYPTETLSNLYDPALMPADLVKAHEAWIGRLMPATESSVRVGDGASAVLVQAIRGRLRR